MLKRLTLVGFKSFADKTEFDFHPGITAIVGPNGSGKSNIVDAVRWVLGEQSAKSLRGGEMADVIFNGSTSRRSLGMAEVTMTFDNSRGVLALAAEEVQITRRVYRSGEGEYLINQQLSRLKDIKDLFLGSGAGADAYCIIEQGRVDVLLQASTKERRVIFEEAAGISRFKAKKTESLRKLERVDQNLQRLRDILDELDKQLRSTRLQASKAQRYQEYSERLRTLRVGLGLRDYHELAGRLAEESAVLDELRRQLQQEMAQAGDWEQQLSQLEEQLTRLEETMAEQGSQLASVQQHIPLEQTTLAQEETLSADLTRDEDRTRTRLGELVRLADTLAASVAANARELGEAEATHTEQFQRVAQLEQTLADTSQRLETLEEQLQADNAEHLE